MPSVTVKANREHNKCKDYGELCTSDLECLPHSSLVTILQHLTPQPQLTCSTGQGGKGMHKSGRTPILLEALTSINFLLLRPHVLNGLFMIHKQYVPSSGLSCVVDEQKSKWQVFHRKRLWLYVF